MGELIVGIAAMAGGLGLLLSYRRDVLRKKEMVWEFKKRDILKSWYQHQAS